MAASFLSLTRHPLSRYIGFTLIELMVVIAILSTLAAISTPAYNHYIRKARITKAIAEIRVLEKDIFAFLAGNQRFPESLADINRDTLLDPWGNPYEYLNIQTTKNKGKMRKDRFLVPLNSDFDLYSKGEDGLSVPPLTAQQSWDDIVRANDGAFVGLATDY